MFRLKTTLRVSAQVRHILLVFWLACTMATAMETTSVQRLVTQGPRFSGPVSISLQNELDAASSRGRAWLVSSQQADGSWGGTYPTALATLVLLHAATPAEQLPARRGAAWLAGCVGTNPVTGTAGPADMLAWRDLALRMASTTLTGFVAPAQATNAVPAPSVPVPPGPDSARLAQLAAAWPTLNAVIVRAGDTHTCWSLARWLNNTGGTLAAADGRIVDWRNDLAQALVASQRVDPSGHGGFWSGPRPDSLERRVIDTAFALLAMDEL